MIPFLIFPKKIVLETEEKYSAEDSKKILHKTGFEFSSSSQPTPFLLHRFQKGSLNSLSPTLLALDTGNDILPLLSESFYEDGMSEWGGRTL